MFASFIDSLTKTCTCSTNQAPPNVPKDQKPTARVVKKALVASSSSSSSANMQSREVHHVNASNYLPISANLSNAQKANIMRALLPLRDWFEEKVENFRIRVEFAEKDKTFTVVVEGFYPTSAYIETLKPNDLGYAIVNSTIAEAMQPLAKSNSSSVASSSSSSSSSSSAPSASSEKAPVVVKSNYLPESELLYDHEKQNILAFMDKDLPPSIDKVQLRVEFSKGNGEYTIIVQENGKEIDRKSFLPGDLGYRGIVARMQQVATRLTNRI